MITAKSLEEAHPTVVVSWPTLPYALKLRTIVALLNKQVAIVAPGGRQVGTVERFNQNTGELYVSYPRGGGVHIAESCISTIEVLDTTP